jgi:lipoprotein-anchoring transpeptidase ErfK/SrfK
MSAKGFMGFGALVAAAGALWFGPKLLGRSEPPKPAPAPASVAAPKPPEKKALEPAPAAAPRVGAEDVRAMIDSGKLAEAREAAAKLYLDDATPAKVRDELEGEMTRLAEMLFVKRPTERDFEFTTVRPGDSLVRIAKRYKTEKKLPVEFGQIKMFNGLKQDLLSVGMKLKIPKGKVTVAVRRSRFTLHILYEGLIVRTYRCGLGKNDATPAAHFTISTKTAAPTWYPPESTGLKGPIPPNDPRNLLGSHWIGLEHDVHRGLGIHGTVEPSSVGTNSSLGCVRLLNEDVKQVFEIVSQGAEVAILE